jgi:hypothetical protein
MKKWTYPVDDEKNKLNNDLIFLWLDKFCPPKEWCIEISGGEPGLYPEIDKLIAGLSERGYYGLIKTNGTCPLPHSETFQRVAAWHKCKGMDSPPKYYDQMLIIRNPADCWEAKAHYCKDHGIPYRDVVFRDYNIPYEQRQIPAVVNTFIKNWTVMYSSGQLAQCYGGKNLPEATVQNMCPPPQVGIWKECACCCNINGFEMFLSDELEQMLSVREKEQTQRAN